MRNSLLTYFGSSEKRRKSEPAAQEVVATPSNSENAGNKDEATTKNISNDIEKFDVIPA